MNTINRVALHFKNLPRGEMLVPEWGDGEQPLRVFWKPMTMKERHELRKEADGDPYMLAALTIVKKALDAEGNRLFEVGAELEMIRNGSTVVTLLLAEQITREPGLADLAKN